MRIHAALFAFQAVQSKLGVGSVAVVQQFQLQVDGTNEQLSYKATEPRLAATVL